MTQSGAIEGGPQVVGNMVYWVSRGERRPVYEQGRVNVNAGSRLFGFELKRDRDDGSEDRETGLNNTC